MYIRKDFPDTGAVKTGGCVRYHLISLDACWQASSQMNKTPFFINLVKGWHRPERFKINLRIYTSHPSSPKHSNIPWRLHLLDNTNFLWVDVDPFGCNDKPKEFTAGYPQERFGGIHFQLIRQYNIEYCFQICYVITFGTAFHCNILYVIPLFYVYVRGKLHSWLYGMLLLRSSIQRTSQYSGTPLVVS